MSASFTVLNTSLEANKALVGIQPTFKQVPPNLFFSITVTSAPSIAALKAATYPPGPPPITATFMFKSPIFYFVCSKFYNPASSNIFGTFSSAPIAIICTPSHKFSSLSCFINSPAILIPSCT